MIARLQVILPFVFAVRQSPSFSLSKTSKTGYQLRIHPPTASNRANIGGGLKTVIIDGEPAALADTVCIDILHDQFDRRWKAEREPSDEVLNEVFNEFLAELRFVTRAARAGPINIENVTWRLDYLRDDETPFEEDPENSRVRAAQQAQFQVIIADAGIWEAIQELPDDSPPPEWDSLILDATHSLPHVGAAIVLASAALEVMIADSLNVLTEASGSVDDVWNSIQRDSGNTRPQPPGIEDKYDVLLKKVTGTSLKDDNDLWTEFKHLWRARNNFVHGGVASTDKKKRGKLTPISVERAKALVNSAHGITKFVQDLLPEHKRWLQYRANHSVEFIVEAFRPSDLISGPTQRPGQRRTGD